jgi:polyisoprenoid-binding protein YceI
MRRTVPQRLTLTALFAVVALVTLLIPSPLFAVGPDWEIDGGHSEVSFSIRHFLTPVPGRFNRFDGNITFDPEHLDQAKVEITVQAASIDTNNAERDRHLRSPDFFDVAKYPTLHFESRKFTANGDALEVTGDLTLHGVTQEITVPVEFLGTLTAAQGSKAGFATEFTINRKDFGIRWNRTLDQGGAVLGEDVKIRINIEANQRRDVAEKVRGE